MNSTLPVWAKTPEPAQDVFPPLAPVCHCGQDLDVTRGNHCPRCGTALLHAASLTLAA